MSGVSDMLSEPSADGWEAVVQDEMGLRLSPSCGQAGESPAEDTEEELAASQPSFSLSNLRWQSFQTWQRHVGQQRTTATACLTTGSGG